MTKYYHLSEGYTDKGRYYYTVLEVRVAGPCPNLPQQGCRVLSNGRHVNIDSLYLTLKELPKPTDD